MIKLTPSEAKLFNLLLEMTRHHKLDITLRVAGGWVRDKLLDRRTPMDIDIALDKMMGERFAEILHGYLQMSAIESHGFGVIKKNPEKSKHLETATIKIFDYWIDFVNLRGEQYADDSRIPLQTIGTPAEDAFRRDFTINTLFYNINTLEVEDFTKLGMEDLQNGFIRTPLDPFQTFMDDPLRILRGFRFAARFGFTIDQQALEAANNPKIKEAFVKKISKERIGKEFYANFVNHEESKDYFDFFGQLHKANYWPLILNLDNPKWIKKGFSDMEKIDRCMNQLRRDFEHIIAKEENSDPLKGLSFDEFAQFTLIAVFTMETFDPKLKDHRKQFVFNFVANCLKLSNKYAEYCCKVQGDYYRLKAIISSGSLEQELEALALWQRSAHAFWPLIESLFNILDLQYDYQAKKTFDLETFFDSHSLVDFFLAKPLFNGSEIKDYFGVDGRTIKTKQDEIMLWQIRNPRLCKEDYLRAKKLI